MRKFKASKTRKEEGVPEGIRFNYRSILSWVQLLFSNVQADERQFALDL